MTKRTISKLPVSSAFPSLDKMQITPQIMSVFTQKSKLKNTTTQKKCYTKNHTNQRKMGKK